MAAVVAAVMVAALLPVDAGGWRLVPIALVLVALGAYTVDPAAMALVATIAYLLGIGFLVNRLGIVSWHGTADLVRILVVTASSGVGLGIGMLRQWWRNRQLLTIPDAWLSSQYSELPSSNPMDRKGVTGG
jgi:hypothetical protein